MTFSDVVEVIKSLSLGEKREIQLLLQQYLCEERRDEIYDNFKSAQIRVYWKLVCSATEPRYKPISKLETLTSDKIY